MITESRLPKQAGRRAFGLDPAGYDAARPPYPDWVFKTLCARCGLGPGRAVFEIGPGTGTATRRLLDLGADPLTAIEPDPRLAAFLTLANQNSTIDVRVQPFEHADITEGAYDLGVCATAFHWLREYEALDKIARLLRPGGWWAAIWNVFGDDSQIDPFHLATKEVLGGPSSPAEGERGIPFGLDTEARLMAIQSTGAFDSADCMTTQWPLALDTDQTVALYATYSNVNARANRDAILAELGRIARNDFGDRVVRNMTTSLYIARRA